MNFRMATRLSLTSTILLNMKHKDPVSFCTIFKTRGSQNCTERIGRFEKLQGQAVNVCVQGSNLPLFTSGVHAEMVWIYFESLLPYIYSSTYIRFIIIKGKF